MARNYSVLNRYKIKKFRSLRSSKSKNDIVIILGPIAKFKPSGTKKDTWVGTEGVYYVLTMKRKAGDWVYGSIAQPIDYVNVSKTIAPARRMGKAIYYAQYGKMKQIGPAVRADFMLNGSN